MTTRLTETQQIARLMLFFLLLIPGVWVLVEVIRPYTWQRFLCYSLVVGLWAWAIDGSLNPF